MLNGVDDIKRTIGKSRFLALVEREGLRRKAGKIECPARCADKPDSCSVNEKNGVVLWHCHRCDEGGDVISMIEKARSCDFVLALEYLRGEGSMLTATVKERAPRSPPPPTERLWTELVTEDPAGIEYLRGRGLEGAVAVGAVRFNVGRSSYGWLNGKARENYRIAVPMYSVDGQLCTLQFRSITPNIEPKEAKRSLPIPYPPGGAAMGMVAEAKTAARVYLTEGIADTLAVRLGGVVAIGAPGVDQLRHLPGFLGQIQGREFVICPQNDGTKATLASQTAFRELAAHLNRMGAVVRLLETPSAYKDPAAWLQAVGPEAFRRVVCEPIALVPPSREPDEDDGEDESAFVAAGTGALKVVARLHPDPRPEVRITTEQHEVNDRAVEALASDERVFQRSGMLVHVVRDCRPTSVTAPVQRPPLTPRIAPLPMAVLRERLAATSRWHKFVKKEQEWVPAHPPDWSVQAIHARGSWQDVRRLQGVVETPALRPDGTVISQAGYDDATELLFEPTAQFLPIAAAPSRDDATAALAELADVARDFPFAKPAHRSAWIAAVLTPFARHAFVGPVPLFLIEANVRGAGKSLLTDIIGVIATGRHMARMTYPRDEEEMRKLITSILLAGDALALLDNVAGSIGGPTLDALLTSTTFSGRLLGANIAPQLLALTVWFATGNNVVPNGDTNRRTLRVRLESELENPEQRDNFTHADILAWVSRERPRLVRAALTVLRAYFVAGRPSQKMRPFGSYNGWSDTVRAALVWAGLADPHATVEGIDDGGDVEAMALAQLIAGLEEVDPLRAGVSVRDLMHKLEDSPAKYPSLREGIDELCPAVAGKPVNAKSLGNKLRYLRGRVVGGLCIDKFEDRDKIGVWRVRSGSTNAESAGSAGSAGSVSLRVG